MPQLQKVLGQKQIQQHWGRTVDIFARLYACLYTVTGSIQLLLH